MELVPGAIVGQRYRAEQRLGAGGVGEVWAGVDVESGAKVAIKKLLPAASAHREQVARFKREANFLSRIHSEYVAKVVDFFSDKTHGLVLILELIDGEALNDVLYETRLAVEDAVDVAWDVMGGVSDLHRQQIIHRDLKPGNIMLQRLPSCKRHAVIVDFGMSRLEGLDKDGEEITALTRADIAVGTMEYMAPEQILNSRGVTGTADIYAVGAMLYRAIAGQHVFGELTDALLARHKMITDPPPLSSGRTDALARGLEAIVMRMIRRKPGDRYPRAEDVLADLAALRAGAFRPPDALPSNPSNPSNPYASNPSHPSQPSHPSLPSISSPTMTSLGPEPPPARSGARLFFAVAFATIVACTATAGFVWRQQLMSVLSPGAPANAAPESPDVTPLSAEVGSGAVMDQPTPPSAHAVLSDAASQTLPSAAASAAAGPKPLSIDGPPAK